MAPSNPELDTIFTKAKAYLSDHVLEFYELYDLFCSKNVTGPIEKGTFTGADVYNAIIDAFSEKYSEVLESIKDKKFVDNGIFMDADEEHDYTDLFIKLMDDNRLTPRELYFLENHTKVIGQEEKYEKIRKVLDYQQALKSLHHNREKLPDFDGEARRLRESSGFTPLQLIKIESKIALARVKRG